MLANASVSKRLVATPRVRCRQNLRRHLQIVREDERICSSALYYVGHPTAPSFRFCL